jgi:hypothetical protein
MNMYYRQRNNTLLFINLYSTHYIFRPQLGHLQVLQILHILLPNCNVNIPIFINGSYKLVPIEFTDWTKLSLDFG